MGGLPQYGVNNYSIMIKGCYMSSEKFVITLTKVFNYYLLFKCNVAADDNNLEPI